ncbi:uncharacterized protein BDR25DRAFT_235764, partial [Lindgomyces ingoldianus]
YAAPEVSKYALRNSSSDIWSLGCVFLEMWTSLFSVPVASLHDHLEKNGTQSACYHLNMSVMDSWFISLQLLTILPMGR